MSSQNRDQARSGKACRPRARCAQFPSRRCARRAGLDLATWYSLAVRHWDEAQHRPCNVRGYPGRPPSPRRRPVRWSMQRMPSVPSSPSSQPSLSLLLPCHFPGCRISGQLQSHRLPRTQLRQSCSSRDCCDHAGVRWDVRRLPIASAATNPSITPAMPWQQPWRASVLMSGAQSSCSSCWRSCRWPALRARGDDFGKCHRSRLGARIGRRQTGTARAERRSTTTFGSR